MLAPALFETLNIVLKSIDLCSFKSFSISKALNNGKYVMTCKRKQSTSFLPTDTDICVTQYRSGKILCDQIFLIGNT